MTIANQAQLDANKAVVQRFNLEVIEQGNLKSFHELMASSFINHTAVPGSDSGPSGMIHTFNNILRPAISNLKVTIHQQIAENDLVTTRKTISGVHSGPFFGIAPTGLQITIEVIDIVRLSNGQYIEHWGINTLAQVLQHLGNRHK